MHKKKQRCLFVPFNRKGQRGESSYRIEQGGSRQRAAADASLRRSDVVSRQSLPNARGVCLLLRLVSFFLLCFMCVCMHVPIS